MVKFQNRYYLIRITRHAKHESSQPSSSSSVPNSGHRGISWHALKAAIGTKMAEMHGDVGAAAAMHTFSVKVCSPHVHVYMVRMRRESGNLLASTLPFINTIDRASVSLETLHVGGSIRSCDRRLMQIHRAEMLQVLANATTNDARIAIQAQIRRSHGDT